MLMGNLEAWKGRGGNLVMPAVRQIHTLGLPTSSSLERGLGKGIEGSFEAKIESVGISSCWKGSDR